MAKLNIYQIFATAVVLIVLDVEEEKKIEKEEEGLSGFNLYLLIEQLTVLIKP